MGVPSILSAILLITASQVPPNPRRPDGLSLGGSASVSVTCPRGGLYALSIDLDAHGRVARSVVTTEGREASIATGAQTTSLLNQGGIFPYLLIQCFDHSANILVRYSGGPPAAHDRELFLTIADGKVSP